jgi:hypothetical protein
LRHLFLVSILFSFQFAAADSSRCHRYRNSFVLNKANVNAIIALSCSALSHTENERRNMQYEDSMTTFHQWSTTGDSNSVRVEGHCAIPYPNLKEGVLDRYQIQLTFTKTLKDNKEVTIAEGNLIGKSVRLEFSDNEFVDFGCSDRDVSIQRLQQIGLGSGYGMQDLWNILRSQRSPSSLNLLETESWIQGQSAASFSGLGLQYRMGQFNGRQLAFAVSPSPSNSELHIRSANYLEYAEGTDFFAFEKDSFGIPRGFANEDLPVNHKFQAYSIINGAQMLGCSSLIYDGELDRPQDLDMETCRRRLDNSVLKTSRRPLYVSAVTREEQEAQRLREEQQLLLRRVGDYLNRTYGPLKRYASTPGVYQTGHAAWNASDVARGYVVFQRTVGTNVNGVIQIVEHRYNKQGQVSTVHYSVRLSDL